jgi:hypothetical protein
LATVQVCPDFTGKALGMDNCFTAFAVLVAGMVFGVCLLICECFSRIFKSGNSIFEMYGRRESLTDDELAREISEMEEKIFLLKMKRKQNGIS